MNFIGLLIFAIYAALFMGVFVAVILWVQQKRRTRRPCGKDVRLMRMPREYLWHRVIKHDEFDMLWTFGLMLVPIIVGGVVLQITALFLGKTIAALVIAIVLFVFSMLLCIQRLVIRLRNRSNEYLGFFGERYVAECLEPLKSKGWFIFHDIQCDGATGKFNLDHVAVGPGGIWVVETKTRRKGHVRSGFKENHVTFDGLKIIWPWWDDTTSIRQAANNANWLQKWLQTMTGKKFDIAAVLAFPGFLVEEQKLGGVRLAEPPKLPQVLTGHGKIVLSVDDLDLIRRQLEAKCRDVEY